MATCDSCGNELAPGARFCAACGAAVADVGDETRKVVTVLFADVVGSTALGEQLETEALRDVMTRFFALARGVVGRHGGTVEKFVGDAVAAVFGVPIVHEDDALRAVRAAAELRDELADLNRELEREHGIALAVRAAVDTAEVVVGGSSPGHYLATTLNAAKRLEEAAGAGEILLGAVAHGLVRDAVRAEPLSLPGPSASRRAYRLLEVRANALGRTRRLDTPMVGRERERRLLEHAFAAVVSGRECRLFTVLGAAGIGKSRLVAEFLAAVGDTTVLHGRCLPYGDGITFWPLAEALRHVAGLDGDESPELARAKLAALLPDDDRPAEVVERVAEAIGLAEVTAPVEEGFWAVRTLLEALARRRPLVVVLDDVQWGEPLLLDLVEYVAGWSRGVPILLLCVARPELLEARPLWAIGASVESAVHLEALTDDGSDALLANLLGQATLPARLRARVKQAAEGNPLFLEETLAMLVEGGALERADDEERELAVPQTIQALLSARLDQLGQDERTVLACGAIEGHVFHLGAVAELAPSALRPHVASRLLELVRKDVLRSAESAFAGEDAFRFRHLLIRDAAYGAVPKRVRADLHERYATWLEERAGDRLGEWEEIAGYHLEQAHGYGAALGPDSDRLRALAARASAHLGAAGRRALARSDMSAAASLLSRAVALLPPGERPRVELLPDLASALQESGRFPEADAALAEALAEAAAAGDERLEAHARIGRLRVRMLTAPEGWVDDARSELDGLLTRFARLGDESGLARCWLHAGEAHWMRCEFGAASDAYRQSLAHAIRAGDTRLASEIRMRVQAADVIGPTAVSAAAPRCEETLADAEGQPTLEAGTLLQLAVFRAMDGRFEEARELLGRADRVIEELGTPMWIAAGAEMAAWVELLAGDRNEAERRERRAYALLEQRGEAAWAATHAATLARILYDQGRYDEADALTEASERHAASDDRAAQIGWRQTRSKIHARRGEHERAELLAREAADLAEGTDALDMQATALVDLAEVLRFADRRTEAVDALTRALRRYERKGNAVSAGRARTLLAQLGDGAAPAVSPSG